MGEHTTEESSQIPANSALATAAFVQAWENVRHIRGERIWFTNVYTAVVAGGLVLLQRDIGASASKKPLAIIGFVVLLLFSFASLLSSVRLVAELRNSIANLQGIIDEYGMTRMVGPIEPPRGFASRLPVRWVFPIFLGLTTAAILMLLIMHVLQ